MSEAEIAANRQQIKVYLQDVNVNKFDGEPLACFIDELEGILEAHPNARMSTSSDNSEISLEETRAETDAEVVLRLERKVKLQLLKNDPVFNRYVLLDLLATESKLKDETMPELVAGRLVYGPVDPDLHRYMSRTGALYKF